MDITMLSERGVPLMCETEGCGQRASSVWSASQAARCCAAHSPMANVAPPLLVKRTSYSLCHACGRPVPAAQLAYPGTAG